jgi:adenine deaminase
MRQVGACFRSLTHRMLPNVHRVLGRFAVMVALGCFAPAPLRANPADILLLNGRIVTLDDASSINEALAITGDRIAATGSGDEMRKLAGPDTKIIGLGGRTVIPGLIDSHIHLIRAGFRYASEVYRPVLLRRGQGGGKPTAGAKSTGERRTG